MKKGLIIFDFDGVIVDSIGLLYSYTKRSIPFLSWGMYQEIFDSKYFMKSIFLYRRLFRRGTTESLDKRRSNYTKEKISKTKLVPNIESTIKYLSQNYTLAINTNSSTENMMPILEKYDLKKYFDLVKTRDDNSNKAEKNIEILRELNVNADDALYVGDSFRDVTHAKIAGMKSIGVLTGVHDRKHFNRRKIKNNLVFLAEGAEEIKTAADTYFGDEGE